MRSAGPYRHVAIRRPAASRSLVEALRDAQVRMRSSTAGSRLALFCATVSAALVSAAVWGGSPWQGGLCAIFAVGLFVATIVYGNPRPLARHLAEHTIAWVEAPRCGLVAATRDELFIECCEDQRLIPMQSLHEVTYDVARRRLLLEWERPKPVAHAERPLLEGPRAYELELGEAADSEAFAKLLEALPLRDR